MKLVRIFLYWRTAKSAETVGTAKNPKRLLKNTQIEIRKKFYFECASNAKTKPRKLYKYLYSHNFNNQHHNVSNKGW